MDGEYKMKLYKNKEWLQEKFKELKYAQTIGKEIGVSGDTIEYWRKNLIFQNKMIIKQIENIFLMKIILKK